MYDSMQCVCRNHLHFIHLTDDFDFHFSDCDSKLCFSSDCVDGIQSDLCSVSLAADMLTCEDISERDTYESFNAAMFGDKTSPSVLHSILI